MANQTAGINVQDRNPYNITVTNSGTLIGNDVEVVYNQATVLSKQDLATCIRQILLIVEQGPFGNEQFGPNN